MEHVVPAEPPSPFSEGGGEPFAPRRPGCGGRAVKGHCGGRVEVAGLAYFPDPPRVWLGFACAEHRHQLIAARPLTEKDRAELAARREQRRRVVEDHQPYEPLPPLATGREARELVERAKRWAAAHGPDL